MEYFLQNISRTCYIVSNCVQQENRELLLLNLPIQMQNFLLFYRFLKNNMNADVNNILSQIVNLLYHQLRLCDEFLARSYEQSNAEVRLPVLRQGNIGRPKLQAPVAQITLLRQTGLSWKKISNLLNISRVTLWNLRNQNFIEDRRAYSVLNDNELLHIIYEIKSEHPQAGLRYVWGSLKARSIYVRWERLVTLFRTVDPIGILLRRRRRLRRRQYKVKAANYMWHMDGNEKMVRWNMYFHGCVDGFSRKIIYLQVAVNKEAETVLSFFHKGVEENGLPMRVRADYGTETFRVIDYMHQERADTLSPFIQGRSVHNTRIERLWGEVNRVVSFKFRRMFHDLEAEGVLNQHSQTDILCLCYVFLPRIQKSLLNFQNCWNNHALSSARNSTPDQLWLISLLQLSYERNVISSNLVPEQPNIGSRPVEAALEQVNLDLSHLGLEPDASEHFISVAHELVPNPLLDDHNEGKILYMTLRNYFYYSIILGKKIIFFPFYYRF